MLIDLTYEIGPNVAVHPFDRPIDLYQEKFLEPDSFNGYRLETGMHVGTHIDAPMHMSDDGWFIAEFPFERFCGPGKLLDARGETTVRVKPEYHQMVHEDDIVIIVTGHGVKWGTSAYYQNHPIIDIELAQFFVDKKVKIVGMDLPSPDGSPYTVHKTLLENDIFIIENLANLPELERAGDFRVYAFPLRISAEASLLRVVAETSG